MEGILQQIGSQEVWEGFLAARLKQGRFTWKSFEEADTYVGESLFLPEVLRLAKDNDLGIPERSVINKMGTGKKRVVYHYPNDKMRILKMIAFLLYRYDGIFAPNCYAFRRGVRASDAIRKINRELNGKRMWAYKVDIHNYFNSISVPILLPMLSGILKDEMELYRFFERMLDDDRAWDGETLIHEQRGAMAGLPTASFLANVYLSEVDHYFHDAGVLYARYSDDIILFAPDRETLDGYRDTLMAFFRKYRLEVNPSKEQIFSPDEPYEFLGFRCFGNEVDIARGTREKIKGKIRRKARSLHRWFSIKGKDPELAVRAMIRSFNRKFFESDDEDSLCWARWFFPVINRTEGLHEIDRYLQDYCRYVATGRHNKTNYRLRYTDLKDLGYRSLVHEFFKSRE